MFDGAVEVKGVVASKAGVARGLVHVRPESSARTAKG